MLDSMKSNNSQNNIFVNSDQQLHISNEFWSWPCSVSNTDNVYLSSIWLDQSNLSWMHSNQDYWLCNSNQAQTTIEQLQSVNLCNFMFANRCYGQQSLCEFDYMKLKNRKKSLPDIDNNLVKLLHFIERGNQVSFERCFKSARGLFHGLSKRRSQYIGVLKNGVKCQVLLNEGKTKKYIGTYPSEVEAAIVHDFYAIGINGLSAKTNFDYNERQVAAMIQSYFESNKSFEPSIFASHIY